MRQRDLLQAIRGVVGGWWQESLTCVGLRAGADCLVPRGLAVSIDTAGRTASVHIVSAGVNTPPRGPLALLVKVTVSQLVALPLLKPGA